MAKSGYGRDMFRQLTEVMARLEKVEEGSREAKRKHESEIRRLKVEQKEEIQRIKAEHHAEMVSMEKRESYVSWVGRRVA